MPAHVSDERFSRRLHVGVASTNVQSTIGVARSVDFSYGLQELFDAVVTTPQSKPAR